MEGFKKDVLDYVEHLKRSVKGQRRKYYNLAQKYDICAWLDDVKKYIEEHD